MESLIEVTPSGLNIQELIGFTTSNMNLPGVLALVFQQKSSLAGFTINSQLSMLSVSWPNLVEITGATAPFTVSNNPVLTSISAPNLVSTKFQITSNFNPLLTTYQLPKLVTVGSTLNLTNNVTLSTVSFPVWLPTNTKSVVLNDCALTQVSVDHVLARCVANPAYVSGTVNLSGGTNATPGVQGQIDKTTLIARGVSVTTN